jgi:hypothetical protein
MNLGHIFSRALGGLLALGLVACGSDNDGGGSSGVTGSKQLSALSAAEVGNICDWAAAKYGGYGHEISCGKDTDSTWSSQSVCVNDFTSSFVNCKNGTVAQLEGCVNKLSAAPCDATQQESAECKAFNTACGG